jgi:hypothetical protein
MLHTLDYTIDQLDRLHDRIRSGAAMRIVHILSDYSDGFSSHWEDRYIVIIDCDLKTYTMLLML